MISILDRFLKYVAVDTTADEDAGVIPSFQGERELAELLKTELEEMGVQNAAVTEDCFVFATIPPSPGYEDREVVGLLAHLDTAPDCIGRDVKPIVHQNYDGGVLMINKGKNLSIDPAQYAELRRYAGDDIVTSDGTTLLGADDKAGIAIIMNVAERLLTDDSIKHGKVRIAFTPDEEVTVGGASYLMWTALGQISALPLMEMGWAS